jgi:hypothetical protein
MFYGSEICGCTALTHTACWLARAWLIRFNNYGRPAAKVQPDHGGRIGTAKSIRHRQYVRVFWVEKCPIS